VGSRLYNKNKVIRSYTLFFRLNGILLTNGLIKKTIKSIPTGKTAQPTKQPISIREREERNRQWDAATTEQEAIYAKLLVINATIRGIMARVFINSGC
jgi:hypothetical protein